jgi:hypothetical protein
MKLVLSANVMSFVKAFIIGGGHVCVFIYIYN